MGTDQEFGEYVGTRWPRMVRTLVLAGASPDHAADLARVALTDCRTRWARIRRADDREVQVHAALVDAWRAHDVHGAPPDLPGDAAEEQVARAVQQALALLAPDDRLATVLHGHADLDELQLATVLDTAADVVTAALTRGDAALEGHAAPVALALGLDPRPAALLETAGEQVLVLAPPEEQIEREARARRRRRAAVGAGVAAAVVAALLVGQATVGPTATPGPTDAAGGPPEGSRFVGVGRAVIAVPEEWRPGADCGDALCLAPTAAATTAVELEQGNRPADFEPTGNHLVSGEPAERSATTCTGGVCRAAVYVPVDRASFRVQAPTPREVNRLLRGVRILSDRVAVPGYASLASRGSGDDAYLADLSDLGLDPQVELRDAPGARPGAVLDVDPAPGTVLEPGATVTMTVAAGQQPPQDEVAVGLGTVDENRVYRYLTDAEVRDGATLRVPEGSDIWAYADGRYAEDLQARQRGSSIAIDFWRNGPNWPTAWEAVLPGTTRLTLSVRVDGRRVDLGTVRLVVVPQEEECESEGGQNRMRKASRQTPLTGDQSASGTRENPSRS